VSLLVSRQPEGAWRATYLTGMGADIVLLAELAFDTTTFVKDTRKALC